ncbi:hypothetical protein [Paenibacillus sp. NPDC057967]|uniref:GntT/GntP/DsdX family permease n=1 Tax=Paenibacillus sp. NPDC057967 TaxID=3346293 RepID=UPI0036D97B77
MILSAEVIQLGPIISGLLFACMIFIVFATAKWKLHPFLSIIAAPYILALGTNLVGKLSGQSVPITGIGLVIILGTIIGKALEKTGASKWRSDRLKRSKPAIISGCNRLKTSALCIQSIHKKPRHCRSASLCLLDDAEPVFG